MDVKQLLLDVTSDANGAPVKIGDYRGINGPIPFLIYGSGISATINIQGTIATDDEVAAATCTWITIDGGDFTTEKATALFAPFTHVRGQVTSYSAGTISMRMLL